MGEAKLYFEDVKEGDEAPALSHTLTRTDLVRYAGASGDYNPMHHDEVKATAAGPAERVRPRDVLDGSAGHGAHRLRRGRERHPLPGPVQPARPGRARSSTTKIVVTGKRVEDGKYLVDLDCSLANDEGEVKVVGEATARCPA